MNALVAQLLYLDAAFAGPVARHAAVDTDHDRVFDAAAARDYGLIDHVIERRSVAASPR